LSKTGKKLHDFLAGGKTGADHGADKYCTNLE
jgi:hypothetical protein